MLSKQKNTRISHWIIKEMSYFIVRVAGVGAPRTVRKYFYVDNSNRRFSVIVGDFSPFLLCAQDYLWIGVRFQDIFGKNIDASFLA